MFKSNISVVSGAPRQEVVCAEASYPPPPPPPPPPGPPPPPVMNALHITEPPSSAPEPALEGTAALMQELTSNRKQLKVREWVRPMLCFGWGYKKEVFNMEYFELKSLREKLLTVNDIASSVL